ncbi:MAG: 6,7-dimethyl-8-ribityllumazine synthase [Gammaproteobacteria bacterium]
MLRSAKSIGRYAIVAADFYRDISDALVAGAEKALIAGGVARERIDCVRVPGAFEIPFACKRLLRQSKIARRRFKINPGKAPRDFYDAIITLGAVVRGETPHFDYVAGECARGIMQLNLRGETPVIFGVLTTDTIEQARARAADGDKGGAAARAALTMARIG